MAKGVSVHIGVNSVDPDHYAGWSGPLLACEADAEDMQAIATQMGYEPVHMLTTENATRDAVISAIRDAAVGLRADDILFLTYSGHGGQVPDLEDEEPDLRDETWCLYDGQLIDDELRELWAAFESGVRILVLSDSCHSGTATRSAYDELVSSGVMRRAATRIESDRPVGFRAMPDEAAFRTYRANRTFYQGVANRLPAIPSTIQATVRLLSGCQDNQLSMDGTFNGLFTGTLLRVWNDGNFDQNYHRFHRAIIDRMPPTQSPNHYVYGQPDAEFDAQRPFEI